MTDSETSPGASARLPRDDSPVLLRVIDGLAHVEFNRPTVLNALNTAMVVELERVVREVSRSSDVKAVILSGRGAAFCAGGDVQAMASATDHAIYIKDLAEGSHAVIRLLDEMPKALVARVHGAVAGAGLGYMCSADFVVAAKSTRIKSAFIGVGASPDSGTSHALPRIIGMRRALELTMLNRTLDADEALDWGLVSAVHDDEESVAAATSLARNLGNLPPRALGLTRQVVRRSFERSLSLHLDTEAAAIFDSVSTEDARSRIRSVGSRAVQPPS